MSKHVKIDLKPTEQALMELEALYYAFDLLIVQNGFIGSNIVRKKGEKVLFWNWAIVHIGKHSIPAPIHTCSVDRSVLFDHLDREVEMANEECARVTAIFYLDMLCRFARDWGQVSPRLHPFFIVSLQPGVDWLRRLSSQEYLDIVHALKDGLTEAGRQVLD